MSCDFAIAGLPYFTKADVFRLRITRVTVELTPCTLRIHKSLVAGRAVTVALTTNWATRLVGQDHAPTSRIARNERDVEH